MTWREDDMYPYVRRNLRARYPLHKGWEIYEKDRWKGYEPDFVIERKTHGRIRRAIVEVKAECRVSQSHIDQLNSYVKKLSGGSVRIVEKILVVPAGAYTLDVPTDIEIMFLRSFKCEDSDIIWHQ